MSRMRWDSRGVSSLDRVRARMALERVREERRRWVDVHFVGLGEMVAIMSLMLVTLLLELLSFFCLLCFSFWAFK